MNTITPYERKVFYYETDKMGIMHHSNYIRIFEETRVHYLSEAGMPFEQIEAQGVLMPVLSVECRYKRPLKFDEPFAVYPKITKFNGTTLNLEYKIISRKTGELCAEGSSSHCFTDTNMKPLRTKLKYPDIYKIFADYNGYEITE
ncbi:acyl-CoA thioesterase [Ruminococcus flavefaciens]|uniref:acyl-CoA thioesterase n=1 Tax=Ruminococcus flavefaciens TaxID=1265 RepID=UPI0026F22F89|nr:acyl-CoA thioesterase [Ruminococcus flavefaciens]MDD7517556.1 acyl-CoA thioesterase [Ruminococcus flavefaciens]MDY5691527.1 acyl-CoA thioesterase [Ruminococcus flavefaciens]